jgi:hypothetical protein
MISNIKILIVVTIMVILSACSSNRTAPSESQKEAVMDEQNTPAASPLNRSADIQSIVVQGDPEAYIFLVEISSPDQGCNEYADWWEVLTEEGELLYRRILLHSHVNEQPFKRSGGPVSITRDTVVVVRAHMHPSGYGGIALRGSVATGFIEDRLLPGLFEELETVEPLPKDCAF